MKLTTFLLVVSCIVVVLGQEPTVVVNIDNGPLEGNLYSTHREFLGIPFTQPPVGNLRWAKPVKPTPWAPNAWNGTYERPGCPQQCNLPSGVCPEYTSEDCLYLNVFTPIVNEENPQPFPVMVFIPGGRFEMGAANTPLYDGSVFCNRSSVILVTINYRLGVLGFLVTPTLKGNYGFQDQLMALEWVQDNIKAFGGDPSMVTIFGESAGGTSAALHLISPYSADLMSQIIIESNPWALPIKTAPELIDLADKFAKDLGCDVTDNSCLLSKSIDDIIIAQNVSENSFSIFHPLLSFLPWTPVVDGDLIPDQPLKLLQNRAFNYVPVMLGTVQDEALIFVASISTTISELEFRAGIIDIFGLVNSFKVIDTYKSYINSTTDYMLLLSRIGTDYIFVCPTRSAARYISNQNVPAFQYQFQHVSSFNVYGNVFPQCADRVCHGLELPYIFSTVQAGGFSFTSAEQQLSYDVMEYWTNFAKTDDPNLPQTPYQWSEYSSSTDLSLLFNTPSQVSANLRKPYCDFWDTIGYEAGW